MEFIDRLLSRLVRRNVPPRLYTVLAVDARGRIRPTPMTEEELRRLCRHRPEA
jgi:hypothetical protein